MRLSHRKISPATAPRTDRRQIPSLAFYVAILFLGMAPVSGGTLVTNLEETGTAGPLVGEVSGGDRRVAQAFTTGSQSSGYSVDNITVAFQSDALGGPADFVIAMYTEFNSEPDSSLGIFSGANPSTAGTYAYTPPIEFGNLAPNTTYFFVMHAEGSGNAFYLTSATTSNDESSTDGWSIADDSLLSQDSGSSWPFTNGSIRFEVQATPVPEPHHYALSAFALFGYGLRKRRQRQRAITSKKDENEP